MADTAAPVSDHATGCAFDTHRLSEHLLPMLAQMRAAVAGFAELERSTAVTARLMHLSLPKPRRRHLPPATPPRTRAARRAERRRVALLQRVEARWRREDARYFRRETARTRGDAWVRGGGPR